MQEMMRTVYILMVDASRPLMVDDDTCSHTRRIMQIYYELVNLNESK